jgi:hypothetical protein
MHQSCYVISRGIRTCGWGLRILEPELSVAAALDSAIVSVHVRSRLVVVAAAVAVVGSDRIEWNFGCSDRINWRFLFLLNL